MSSTILLPYQPDAMTPAQLAAVSYLARSSGHTHQLYAYQLRRWFAWCDTNQLDPLVGIQRTHVELYIRHLAETGLMPSSINTMMHGVRGFFRFAHIDGLIPADPAVYARLPKIHQDESRTQGLDRLELIRFLQVAQTITVHHGALAYLLGIHALRASEAAAVRIEDYRETLCGHRRRRVRLRGALEAVDLLAAVNSERHDEASAMPQIACAAAVRDCRGQRKRDHACHADVGGVLPMSERAPQPLPGGGGREGSRRGCLRRAESPVLPRKLPGQGPPYTPWVATEGGDVTCIPREPNLLLSPESEAVVKATAAVVADHAVEITSRFYPSMFEAHPELLDLFNQGNQANGEQRQALASAVVAYATQLVDPDAPSFRPVMNRIAHKHVSLGIRPEQYTIVGHHLMNAVGEVLGEAVTPAVARAWDEVYWLFSVQLIAEEARLYTLGGVDPTAPWRAYEVIERVQDAFDTVTLILRPQDGAAVPRHLPGQYVSVAVDLPDGSRQPRQYTVSTGARENSVQITVRRLRGRHGAPDGAVSTYLHEHVSVGDLLEVGPPAGDTVLDEGDNPLVLISAGVGITPVAAILDDLAARGISRPVTVAHADRSAASHPLFAAVSTSVSTLGNVATHTWYERVDAAGAERGARSGLMDLAEIEVPADADVFMCGPLPFMRNARSELVRRGLPSQRIRYEVFGPDMFAGSTLG